MAKRRAKNATAEPPSYPYIAEALWPLAVPVESLELDPKNANKHDERGIAKIAGSLRAYGQRTPIVVQVTEDGRRIIRKGNGTWLGIKLNGWSHVAAVPIEESDSTATGYAIADNATGRYSEWDQDVLAELLNSEEPLFDDPELVEMQSDLESLLATLNDVDGDDVPDGPDDDSSPSSGESKAPAATFSVLVNLADEAEQVQLLERLSQEGYTCRAFVS